MVVSYIGKRIMAIVPIVFIATLVTFALIHISPVDPAEAYLTAAHIYPTPELLEQKGMNSGSISPY